MVQHDAACFHQGNLRREVLARITVMTRISCLSPRIFAPASVANGFLFFAYCYPWDINTHTLFFCTRQTSDRRTAVQSKNVLCPAPTVATDGDARHHQTSNAGKQGKEPPEPQPIPDSGVMLRTARRSNPKGQHSLSLRAPARVTRDLRQVPCQRTVQRSNPRGQHSLPSKHSYVVRC